MITASLDPYYKSLSPYEIRDHLDQFYKVKPARTTISNWVKKYAKKRKYTDALKPKIKVAIHVDEVYVRKKTKQSKSETKKKSVVKEGHFCCFNEIDKRARYRWTPPLKTKIRMLQNNYLVKLRKGI